MWAAPQNLVRQHWLPDDEQAFVVPEETKGQVREGLLRLILFVPELLQSQLSEALSNMSVRDARARPLGLSQDQVNTLHDAACAPSTGQGHDPHQTSAMDRYMEMKTQQDLDNISCNH